MNLHCNVKLVDYTSSPITYTQTPDLGEAANGDIAATTLVPGANSDTDTRPVDKEVTRSSKHYTNEKSNRAEFDPELEAGGANAQQPTICILLTWNARSFRNVLRKTNVQYLP